MCSAVDLFGIKLRTSRESAPAESTEDMDLLTKLKATHVGSDAVVLFPEKSWAGMRRVLFAQSAYICREAGNIESAARFACLSFFQYHDGIYLMVSCNIADAWQVCSGL